MKYKVKKIAGRTKCFVNGNPLLIKDLEKKLGVSYAKIRKATINYKDDPGVFDTWCRSRAYIKDNGLHKNTTIFWDKQGSACYAAMIMAVMPCISRQLANTRVINFAGGKIDCDEMFRPKGFVSPGSENDNNCIKYSGITLKLIEQRGRRHVLVGRKKMTLAGFCGKFNFTKGRIHAILAKILHSESKKYMDDVAWRIDNNIPETNKIYINNRGERQSPASIMQGDLGLSLSGAHFRLKKWSKGKISTAELFLKKDKPNGIVKKKAKGIHDLSHLSNKQRPMKVFMPGKYDAELLSHSVHAVDISVRSR